MKEHKYRSTLIIRSLDGTGMTMDIKSFAAVPQEGGGMQSRSLEEKSAWKQQ